MKSKLIAIIILGVVSVAAVTTGVAVYNHTNTSETSEIKSEVSADADSKSNAEETKDTKQTVDIDPATLYNEAIEATKNVQSLRVILSSNLDEHDELVDDISFERQIYIDIASGQEIFDLSGGGHDEYNLEESSRSSIDEILFYTQLNDFNNLTDVHISKVKLNGNERYKLEARDTYNIDYTYYIDPETKLVTNVHEIQPGNVIAYHTFEYNVPYSFGE